MRVKQENIDYEIRVGKNAYRSADAEARFKGEFFTVEVQPPVDPLTADFAAHELGTAIHAVYAEGHRVEGTGFAMYLKDGISESELMAKGHKLAALLAEMDVTGDIIVSPEIVDTGKTASLFRQQGQV